MAIYSDLPDLTGFTHWKWWAFPSFFVNVYPWVVGPVCPCGAFPEFWIYYIKSFKQTRAMTGYDPPKWSGKSSLTLCGLTNSQLLEPQKLGLEDACPIGCCHSWGLWNFSGGFNPERYETVGIIQGFQKMIEMVWSGWTTRHVFFFFCVGWILVDFPASKDKSPQLASRFSPRYWGTGLEMWKALNIF